MSLSFFQEIIARHMEVLSARERFLGTMGHLEAREYIMRQFLMWEQEFFTHEFPLSLYVPQSSSVTLLSPESGIADRKIALESLPGVGCPSAQVQAPVLHVAHGCADDYEEPQAPGKILIASIGRCHETDKVRLAAQRGAVGLLWYHRDLDEIFSGAAHYRASPIPALALRPSAAKALANGTQIKLSIISKKLEMKGQNFYFDLGPQPVRFLLTCHYDSRPQTPGANDNATGVASLLALREAFLQRVIPWPESVGGLRFAFFDAEEVGCQGSEAYAAQLEKTKEWKDLWGVINLDAIGKERLCAVTQDREVSLDLSWAKAASRVFAESGLELEFTTTGSGRSDHAPFVRRGKPALWLSSNPNTVRHTVLDTLSRVDISFMARVAAGLMPLLSELSAKG